MIAFQLDEIDLADVWHQHDPANRGRISVPIHAGTGAASTVLAYLELDPGSHTGRHTDSAEETVLVLEGEAEVVLADERVRLRAGGVAVAPAMRPHDVINVGSDVFKLLLFFTSAAVLTEHDDALAPMGLRIFTLGAPSAEESVSSAR
jgi:quercetin dioxygenase-like cupin family protein